MQINYLPAGGAVGVGEISADQCRSDQIRSERVLGTVPYKLRARAAAQRDNVPRTRNKISWEAIWLIFSKNYQTNRNKSGNPL